MRVRFIVGGGAGIGLIVGICIVSLLNSQQNNANISSNSKGGVIDFTEPTPKPVDALSVASPAPEGNLGLLGLQSNLPGSSSTPGSVAGATNSGGGGDSVTTATNKLPGPKEFGQYDQYKSGESAYFGDVIVGSGAEVIAGSQVTVHYRGWLTDGTQFDESYARGKPYTFQEGAHTVILGWEEGLFGMKAGGTRRLIIPPKVGYGEAGKDTIPPNAVLVFDIELIEVK